MAKKEKTSIIAVEKPEEMMIKFLIEGDTDSRFNMHRLGKKAKEELDNTAEGKSKKSKMRKPRDYEAEFMDSLYFIDAAGREVEAPEKITKTTRFGFPASGFKKAMVFAARHCNCEMTKLRGVFHVVGQFVEIQGQPRRDEFWRRIGSKGPGTGTPDRGIRAAFDTWKAELVIRYVKNLITPESIANLLSVAGFAVGVGEDRPDKAGGTCGMWHLVEKVKK
jgi:hypothetical protein